MTDYNVISVLGGEVHAPMDLGRIIFPFCRTGTSTQSGTTYTKTTAEVTCRNCRTYLDRQAAAKAKTQDPSEIQALRKIWDDGAVIGTTFADRQAVGVTAKDVNKLKLAGMLEWKGRGVLMITQKGAEALGIR